MNNKNKILYYIFTAIIIVLTISLPEISKQSIITSLICCGKIVIPSLFPITFCIVFLTNLIENGIKSNSVKRRIVLTYFFSIIGGYPMGCKTITTLLENKTINRKNAEIIQLFCFNAGPGFIISFIGGEVFNSSIIGLILFITNILSSILLFLFFGRKISFNQTENTIKKCNKSFSEMFVNSAFDASLTISKICIFTIIFTLINSYLIYFSKTLSFLKAVAFPLEITNSVLLFKNIYLISFLSGFGGVCIFFQLSSVSNKLFNPINKLFLISRIIHGLSNVIIMKIFLSLFKIKISTFSNTKSIFFKTNNPSDKLEIIICLFITVTIMIIGIEKNKNYDII